MDHETYRHVAELVDQTIRAKLPSASPIVRRRALLHVLKQLPKYDPKRGSLSTFVSWHVQPILTDAARIMQPLAASPYFQRVLRDIFETKQAFIAVHGREPTDDELSELTHIPARRLRKLLSRATTAVPFSAMVTEDNDDDDESSVMEQAYVTDELTPEQEWADAVYVGLPDVDKLIMQYGTGYRNEPPRSVSELSKITGLPETAVRRRLSKIRSKLQQFHASAS